MSFRYTRAKFEGMEGSRTSIAVWIGTGAFVVLSGINLNLYRP